MRARGGTRFESWAVSRLSSDIQRAGFLMWARSLLAGPLAAAVDISGAALFPFLSELEVVEMPWYEVKLSVPDPFDVDVKREVTEQVLVSWDKDAREAVKKALARHEAKVEEVIEVADLTLDDEAAAQAALHPDQTSIDEAVTGLAEVLAESGTEMTIAADGQSVTVTSERAQKFLDQNPYATVPRDGA